MTYSIAGGKSFNMVLSHPDKGDPSLYGLEEDILGDMRKEFEGWDDQCAPSPWVPLLQGPLYSLVTSLMAVIASQTHNHYRPH